MDSQMQNYVIGKTELCSLLDELLTKVEIIAPVKHENLAKFHSIQSAQEIVWGGPQTVIPPKQFFFPPSEQILTYNLESDELEIKAVNHSKARILFGVHPCDLNAIHWMDQVFAENNQDENYLEKRKAIVLIGLDCLAPCAPESICLRMKGLDPKGRFDLFLTDIGDFFFAEAATEKGEEILKGVGRMAEGNDEQRLSALRQQRNNLFDEKQQKLFPKLEEIPLIMKSKSGYQHPAWEERGKKCYSCGSCNMVCPTCYCFDVQDYLQVNQKAGSRTRTWDGCMLEDFAKVASGENFREDRSERLRHRTNRKLNYLFEKWGESFCTGCGRCIKACLTKIVSPLEIANDLYEGTKA